jgi:hypothetical protein
MRIILIFGPPGLTTIFSGRALTFLNDFVYFSLKKLSTQLLISSLSYRQREEKRTIFGRKSHKLFSHGEGTENFGEPFVNKTPREPFSKLSTPVKGNMEGRAIPLDSKQPTQRGNYEHFHI